MSRRLRSLAHLLPLMALALPLVSWIGAASPAAWFQSPVQPGDTSPVPTAVIVLPLLGISPLPTAQPPPGLRPGVSPLPPGVSPGLLPAASTSAPSASVWSSPLPWIGVGVLVFGLAAWALLSVGRRASEDK